MTEIITAPVPVKKQMSPDQALAKQINVMSKIQTSNRLRRLATGRGLKLRKTPLSNIDSTWAIVLSLVFDNTAIRGGIDSLKRTQ